MRSRLKKDASMIGKLSNKKLNLSFSLSKEAPESNVSAMLASVQSRVKLQKANQSKKSIRIVKRPSIVNEFESDYDSPLPKIRTSFSKILELRKVCRKNPEENLSLVESPSQATQFDGKQSKILFFVGHLYSPRSRSVVQPGHIKHQKCPPSSNNTINNKNNRSRCRENDHQFLRPFQNNKNVRVKIVDYGYKFNQSQGYSLPEKINGEQEVNAEIQDSKEQGTQSRCIPLQQENVVPENLQVHKKTIQLKNKGNEGFFMIEKDQDEEQQDPYDELSFMWEENLLEGQNTQMQKNIFFMEELSEHYQVTEINFGITLSEIKQMLIEEQNQLKINFGFPNLLLNTITETVSDSIIHEYAMTIFCELRHHFKPQLVSFKRFSNCILVTTKVTDVIKEQQKTNKLAILWYYTGRFYVGGWKDTINADEKVSIGFKSGLGLEYYPLQHMYYGNFSKNEREGFGIMKKISKQVYLGEWSRNKRSGWGKLFNCKGELVFDGDFQNGRFTTPRATRK